MDLFIYTNMATIHNSLQFCRKSLQSYYNESKLEGERAILPCNVSSSDNISLVLWYKGSTEEPIYTVDARPDFVGNIQQHFIHANWKKRIDFDLSNKPMAILRMDKVTLADDGIYRCRVDFQHSRTRIYQITLSVIVPPSPPDIVDQMGKKLDGSIGPHDEDGPLRLTCNSFDVKPKEVRITSSKMPLSASKLVKLSCQSSGSRPPAVLTWWKGSKKMTKAVNTFFEDSNVSKSVLTMVPSSEDNNVYLACRAENPNMSNSAKEDGFKLKIYYIPVVTLVIARPSKTDEPYEGEDVFFDCHAQAVPKVHSVQWFLNNRLLRHDPANGIEISPLTLSVLKVNSSNRGKYVCVAKNSEGTGWSNPIYLTVKHSPVCKNSTTVNYRVSLEETANVLCQVDANPPDVTFHWSFNNTVDHMNMVTFTVDGLDSIARYKASDHDDYGHLLCWAENSVGIQGQPCVFHLTYAGYYRMFVVCCASHFEPARSLSIYHRSCFIKVISYLINCPPEAPINCSVGNGSTSVVEVICYAGYNGGLNQTFVMEVYDEPTRQLRANVTNEEEPRFVARNLPAGSSFYVVVYAANAKGASTSLAVAGHTARSRLYDES
ncbi:Cell adhesion molecule 2 [Nymphon striatum]|nr:Cell adhesion molecule 2 [Nymphon striatum]